MRRRGEGEKKYRKLDESDEFGTALVRVGEGAKGRQDTVEGLICSST